MGNTYFVSDCHIHHSKILTLGKGRPFSTVKEMEDTIVNNINRVVREEDTLIFLGDTCFGTDRQVKEFLDRIKCKNTIEIIGNHSKNGIRHFKFSAYRMTIRVAKQYVLLCHYPYKIPWHKRLFSKIRLHNIRPKNNGYWLIHGHSHSNRKVRDKQINVCVDAWDFKPVSLNDITKIIQHKENKKTWLATLMKNIANIVKPLQGEQREKKHVGTMKKL